MQTWWILFAANLLLPLMMLGIGGWFGKHPPRKINHFVGYRTPMSMKNEATWAFAHRACGRLWLRLGAALLPASALGMLCVLGRGEGTVGAVGAGICLGSAPRCSGASSSSSAPCAARFRTGERAATKLKLRKSSRFLDRSGGGCYTICAA